MTTHIIHSLTIPFALINMMCRSSPPTFHTLHKQELTFARVKNFLRNVGRGINARDIKLWLLTTSIATELGGIMLLRFGHHVVRRCISMEDPAGAVKPEIPGSPRTLWGNTGFRMHVHRRSFRFLHRNSWSCGYSEILAFTWRTTLRISCWPSQD